MKWMNKGLEKCPEECCEISLDDGLCLYGVGNYAENKCLDLLHFGLVKCLIDNDAKKVGTKWKGLEIISLGNFLSDGRKEKILISVGYKYEKEIEQQLVNMGMVYGKDFFFAEEFSKKYLPWLLMEQRSTLYVVMSQVSLTERCTLKCKKCAHGCHMVSNKKEDLTLESVKNSIDCFFEMVDYVKYFVLIGGEPLLYKDLCEIIDYISDNYHEKIGRLQITTNGTIMPSEKLIECCKSNDVYFMISNYSTQIPRLKEKLEKLTEKLKDNDIRYSLFPEDSEWMDYGFDFIDRTDSEEKLIDVFDRCMTGCHEVRDNKFYFCVMARSVSENMMGGSVGKDDYIDLSKLNYQNPVDRRIFFEYTQGYSDKGYLEMCKHCNGADSYKYPVPAAEQVLMNCY
jgi:organic radical activating enzyme